MAQVRDQAITRGLAPGRWSLHCPSLAVAGTLFRGGIANEVARGVESGKKRKTGMRETVSSVKSSTLFNKYFDETIFNSVNFQLPSVVT